ncbi:hypothetical protein ACFL5X_02120 [Candidatus Omnitrophota bacterium]
MIRGVRLKAINMKRVFFFVVLVFGWQTVFAAAGFSQSWYARNLLEASIKKGTKYQMVFITKVADKNACDVVLAAKGTDAGRWKNADNRCASGEGMDQAYDPIFSDTPLEGPYLSFIDNYGWPTRINFVDTPSEFSGPTVESLAVSLKEQGLEGVKIIYPSSD